MTQLPAIDVEHVADLIRTVARAEALPRWRNLGAGDITEKAGPEDIVTIADKAVEEALTRALVDLVPGSVVVGEEAVHADPGVIERLRRPGVVWVIDPIDGTSNFAKGSPDFAVMVALVVDRVPFAGWIHLPVPDETTAAVAGCGADQWRDGWWGPLAKPRLPDTLSHIYGISGRSRMSPERQARIDAARSRFAGVTPAICAGTEYPQMAAGLRHFALYNKSEPWDHLPGLAILAEQGFHYARHDGTPYLPGDNTGGLLIAPSPKLWTEIQQLLIT